MLSSPEQPCGGSVAMPILLFTTLSLGEVGKEGPPSAAGIKQRGKSTVWGSRQLL